MCDLTLLKGTQLTVFVDEALPDIIVVTYLHDTRVFRGVLLDATKRNLPHGISQLNPALDAVKPDEDALYSVKQRYAYADSKYTQISSGAANQPTRSLKNNKLGRMTVRLRPRQVLCSKCKDICNENSESITRKRKTVDVDMSIHPIHAVVTPATVTTQPVPNVFTSPSKRSANAPVTRSSHAILQGQMQHQTTKPLPKNQMKDQGALSGIVNKLNIVNNKRALSLSNQNTNTMETQEEADEKRLKRVILTRKKSGLTSDKEKDGESSTTQLHMSSSGVALNNNINTSNTRTIKICYGPQREGTVLKISAPIEPLKKIAMNDEQDIPEENVGNDEIACKASRKALKKKAKKAKRKITFHKIGSPEQCTSRYNPSTSYTIGSSSPRYTVGSASPRHGLGNNSPRFVATLPPIPVTAFEPLPKKRKRKMKHKKKHKEDRQERDRKHKEDGDGKDKDEEKCLTQKLSINLKRLSGTYTTSIVADATSTTSNIGDYNDDENQDENEENDDRNSSINEINRDRDDDSSEDVPDFPPGPIRLKLASKNVISALSAEGGQLIAGDVVWGKIQGFPWWPGKILTITNCDNGPQPQAHVSWYGSSTSSLIQCENLSPYLANFKARYNKKKRGPYKEAIKQATNEARVLADLQNSDAMVSPSSTTALASGTSSATPSTSTSPSRMIMLVQPALASPREINVIS